jgi:integrase
MQIPLTPRLVDSLIAQSGKSRTVYLDTHPDSPRGFALRITAAGARTFYFLRTVRGKGRRPWVRIGPAAGKGLRAARRAAWAVAGRIAEGRDPNEEAKTAKRADRAAKVQAAIDADEWTVVDMLRAYLRARHAVMALRTHTQHERRINREIAGSDLGEMRARDVARDDVRKLIARKAARKPAAAWVLLMLLQAAFRWAMDEDVQVPGVDGGKVWRQRVDRDPTRRIEDDLPKVKAAGGRKRTRVLSDAEIVTLWRGLDELEVRWATFARIVLLCGTRRGETSLARWRDLTLDGPEPQWFIPAANRKGRKEGSAGARRPLTVPLSPLAVGILRELRAGAGGHDAVFAAPISRRWDELLKGISGDVTTHDLRRSCASGLQRLGAPPHVLSVVLGHAREAGATQSDGAYTHDPRAGEHRTWLERWARHVESIIGERRATADVIMPFNRA